jgi:hypothetical protein
VDKRVFTDIQASDGWPAVHKKYPHVHWSTAYYWRTHPAVLVTKYRAPACGHPKKFDNDEEEEIRGKVALDCAQCARCNADQHEQSYRAGANQYLTRQQSAQFESCTSLAA